MPQSELKAKTAKTLKWNTIDRVATQVLYAVVGVVLANRLSQEDFGLVGALLVFQAFATILTDSGFGAALLQKKDPTQTDYSTVFWLNLAVSVGVYWVLWACAPLIADTFQGDRRLIPMSKVMFLVFVINGLAIVQVNRLMKRMDVRNIAVSNVVSLTAGGVLGVVLAFRGFGAWALVWQSLSVAAVKTAWLWATGRWSPGLPSLASLRSLWRIGVSVLSSSALNTLCLHAYPLVIGAFYSLRSLGVYSQADKWSKMGSASISQVLTATFVPVLSRYQDDGEAFGRCVHRINRFMAFITFPALLGLAAVGAPLFHTLFGDKWDAAIPLFQILSVRGVLIVLLSLYGNYLLALGYGKTLFKTELYKDLLMMSAIAVTLFSDSLVTLVWGQLAATAVTYVLVLRLTCRHTGLTARSMLADVAPFAALGGASALAACACVWLPSPAWLQLGAAVCAGAAVYILLAVLLRLPELAEALGFVRGRAGKI